MKPKYYIYISDAKVDMLLPQVPHDIKEKVANEFKLNLKIFEVSRKSETEREDNRVARLQTVVEYVRSEPQVGTIDDPSGYIQAQLPMKWGPYVLLMPNFGSADPNANRTRRGTDFVLFGGSTERTLCGLVGSAHHLVGTTASQDGVEDYGGSAMPMAMHYLEQLANNLSVNQDDALSSISLVIGQLRGPVQHVEFMAKRLLDGSVSYAPKTHCVLASPLYVAMAE